MTVIISVIDCAQPLTVITIKLQPFGCNQAVIGRIYSQCTFQMISKVLSTVLSQMIFIDFFVKLRLDHVFTDLLRLAQYLKIFMKWFSHDIYRCFNIFED